MKNLLNKGKFREEQLDLDKEIDYRCCQCMWFDREHHYCNVYKKDVWEYTDASKCNDWWS